jgi:viroplasmin and RNaseH domain-containing protein
MPGKFYAVRHPFNIVLTSWKECEALVKGNSVKYKSFSTRFCAEAWAKGEEIPE